MKKTTTTKATATKAAAKESKMMDYTKAKVIFAAAVKAEEVARAAAAANPEDEKLQAAWAAAIENTAKAKAAAETLKPESKPIETAAETETIFSMATKAAAANVSKKIIDAIPSRKEQRAAAKVIKVGANPSTLKEFKELIYKTGFCFGLSVDMFKAIKDDSSKEFLENGERNYKKLYLELTFVQNKAIAYKRAAAKVSNTASTSSKEFKAAKAAKNSFYDVLKVFKSECGIDTPCTAADADSIADIAIKFTYKSALITDGMTNIAVSVNRFSIDLFKYLDANNSGLDKAESVTAKRMAK